MKAKQYANEYKNSSKAFLQFAKENPDVRILAESEMAGQLFELEQIEGLIPPSVTPKIKNYVRVVNRPGVVISGFSEGYSEIFPDDRETKHWLKEQDKLYLVAETFKGIILGHLD